MAQDRGRLRIGDNERDAAVQMLQEHHAVGRLDSIEFSERMEKVLSARTQADIDALFLDLPEPKPTRAMPESPSVPAESAYSNDISLYNEQGDHHGDPWYAQWWMILVAVGVTVVSRGNVGFLIPMMAIWLWVIYPSLKSNRRRRPAVGQNPSHHYAPPSFARQLTVQQRRQITAELDRGRRIPAIKLYREFTGAGLKEAKDAIDVWDRQIGN